MRYGKLINNTLQYAPNPIKINDQDIFTNDPTLYGYKPIIYTQPEVIENMMAVFDKWIETETEITRIWKYEPKPIDDEISIEEALDIIMGGAI